MVVLSYNSAKRSLLFMALYLVIASLVIKGLGYVIEFNFTQVFSSIGSLTNFADFNFELPQFDFSTLSFEGIKTFITEKISDFIQILMPAFVGVMNFAASTSTTPAVVHFDKTMMVVKV